MSLAHEKYIEWKHLRNVASIEVDPQTTALLIIDMQEYFLDAESPLNRLGEMQTPGVHDYCLERGKTVVIPNLRRLLEFFRAQSLRVVYTTVASELPDGQDYPPKFRRYNAIGQKHIGGVVLPARTDPWARIVEPLAPRPGEMIINKTTHGSFVSTGLDGTLRNLGIETLVIGGVVTNVCVETTARDASDRGYQVIVVDDASATYSPEQQEATMISLQGSFGYVRMTDDVLVLFKDALPVG